MDPSCLLIMPLFHFSGLAVSSAASIFRVRRNVVAASCSPGLRSHMRTLAAQEQRDQLLHRR